MKVNRENEIVLVGNGPCALTRDMGREIDAFGEIVRFNNFVTDGFEKYVGSRTTIWAQSGYQIKERDWSQFAHCLALIGTADLNANWQNLWHEHIVQKERHGIRISRIDPDLVKVLERQVGRPKLSSGTLAIGHFLEEYKVIHIAGFDHFQQKRHHYESNGTRPSTCPHNGLAEMRWTNNLEKEGRIIRL